MKAVIMAGGQGTRLQPLTYSIPKPLIPIGKSPVLEIIIQRLKTFGFDDIIITTGYMAEIVEAYFRDGKHLGVRIQYYQETSPLGTAGALFALRDRLDQTFLLMNCDIVTDLIVSDMLDFHRHNKAELTVASKLYKIHVPYGVVKLNGNHLVEGITEKPGLEYKIVAGIYIVEPTVLNVFQKDECCDMPAVITSMLQVNKKVVCYPFSDYWLDVGRMNDLEQAAAKIAAKKE